MRDIVPSVRSWLFGGFCRNLGQSDRRAGRWLAASSAGRWLLAGRHCAAVQERGPLSFVVLAGTRVGYEVDEWKPDGAFHCAGEGQVGDQTFVRGDAEVWGSPWLGLTMSYKLAAYAGVRVAPDRSTSPRRRTSPPVSLSRKYERLTTVPNWFVPENGPNRRLGCSRAACPARDRQF